MEHRLDSVLARRHDRRRGDVEHLYEHRLGNGLTLLVVPRSGAPLTASQLYVAAGSRCDEGQHGRAHLVEHWLVRGARFQQLDVEETLHRIGARLVAATHREHLRFGVTALPDEIDVALASLARMVAALPPEPAALAREQAIIGHELMEHMDGIHALWDTLYDGLYEEHPVRYAAVGGEAVLQLGPGDVELHRDRFLRPERAVLAVVGDFHPEALQEAAERHLGAWGSGEAAEPAAGDLPPVLRARSLWQRTEARLQRAYFLLGWPVPPAGSADDAAIAALVRLLGDGPAGVLSQRLREEDAELYDVQATVQQQRDHGLFTVFGSCRRERLEHVVTRIVSLVGASSSGSPLRAEALARLQTGFASSLAHTYETVSERASLLGRTGLCGLRRTQQERVALVRALTLEQVREVGERLLSGVRPALAAIG